MTVEERFEKLDGVMDRLAALDEAMVSLAESAEEQYRRTQEQFRQTDERISELRREVAERDLKTDNRIAALVSASAHSPRGRRNPDALSPRTAER